MRDSRQNPQNGCQAMPCANRPQTRPNDTLPAIEGFKHLAQLHAIKDKDARLAVLNRQNADGARTDIETPMEVNRNT
jgi:hypothetical protein